MPRLRSLSCFRHLVFILCLLPVLNPVKGFSQMNVTGDYYLACCPYDFYERLTLKTDSSFSYEFQWKLGSEYNKGKWHFNRDTLLLYDFKGSKPRTDTLQGSEAIIQGQSAIAIRFRDSHSRRHLPTDFSIDGHCYEYPHDTVMYVPRQVIHKITNRFGQYIVKNPDANDIVIFLDPLAILFPERLGDKYCFLYRNGTFTPIGCSGALEEWNCMEWR